VRAGERNQAEWVAAGDLQRRLLGLSAGLNRHWLAGQHNCGNAGPTCQVRQRPQFRLIAAPSRPSA
jgi:hypothetical protein